ncbi:annexin A7-like [Orbicella faveolata]|uniref:annexin A7-like n=1 Tax=Orbicella faveolata TaxID=48498 RepID=UPI0009E3933F|nr:annexin A7-like [Orbicella faveolata]
MAENDSKPPPYAPPPYPGLADPSAQPQYPPPGQGYDWSQPPTSFLGQHQQPYAGAPPVTHPPALGGAASDKPAGYPVQPGYPGQPPQQPGYPAQPGYPGYPGYQQGYQGYQGYQPGPMTTQTSSVTVVGGMGPSVIVAPQIAPPDYCGLAWFACLFCFAPTGICAILKSTETRQAINRGDLMTANQLSLETRKLANMTIGIGITIFVVSAIIRFALMAVY